MAHAEKCPICNGTGKINKNTCHGCLGKGWIEVGTEYPQPIKPIPIDPIYPKPWIPYPCPIIYTTGKN